MRKLLLLLLFLFGIGMGAYAQDPMIRTDLIPSSPNAGSIVKAGEAPVNISSGLPSVSVPIFTVGGQELSIPVTLNYNYSGYRPAQDASWVGRGWSMEAGGVITRTIRDKVDGMVGAGNYDGTYIQTILNGNDPYTQNFLKNAHMLYDLQLDLYSFSFPGYSGKFVKYKNKYYIFPSQKLKIVGGDSGFIITTENGTKYGFYEIETTNPKGSNSGSYNLPSSYNSSFYLSYVENAQGTERIRLSYVSEGRLTNSGSPTQTYKKIMSGTGSTVTFPSDPSTAFPTYVNSLRLQSITSEKNSVYFQGGGLRTDINQSNGGTAVNLSQINVYANGNMIKKFVLNQSYNGQLQLNAVKECPVSAPGKLAATDTLTYKFEYNAADSFTGGHRAWVDHYGYYTGNGEFAGMIIPSKYYTGGANREPNQGGTMQGAMTKVTYPSSGYTTFSYEQNQVSSGEYEMDGYGATFTTNRGPYGGSHHTTGGGTFTLSAAATVNFHVVRTPYIEQADGFSRNETNDFVVYGSAGEVFSGRIGLESENGGKSYSITLGAGNYTLSLTADVRESAMTVTYGYGIPSTRPKPGINAGGIRLQSMVTHPQAGPPLTRVYDYRDTKGFSSGVSPIAAYDMKEFHDIYVPNGAVPKDDYSFIISSFIGDAPSTELPHYYSTVLEKQIAAGDTLFTRHDFEAYPGSFAGNGPKKITQYRRNGSGQLVPASIKTFSYANVLDTVFTYLKPYQTMQVHLQGGYWGYDLTEHAYDISQDYGVWKYLSSTREVVYEGTDSLVTIVNNSYDANRNLYRSTNSNANGEINISRMKYPQSYSGGFSTMLDAHVLSPLIEQQQWNSNGTDSVLVSGSLISYSPITFKPLSRYTLDVKNLNSLNNESKTGVLYDNFLSDSRYQERVSYSYDAKGRLVSQQLVGGVPVSYKWGYAANTYPATNTGEMNYPIAEAKNALPSEIYLENFEEHVSGTTGSAHSGDKYFNGDYYLNWAIPNGRSYVVSFFYLSGGKWQYKRQAYTGAVSLIDGDGIDDVAIYPSDAQLSSITYLQGTGNQATIDTKGNVAFYEYDELNRLVNIKDQNGDIVKNYVYNHGTANEMYYNTVKSGMFTKNDCSSGIGSVVPFSIPANSYSSTSSQAAADALAIAALATNGQANANATGVCTTGVTISYLNDTFAPFDGYISQLQVKNASGTVLYTFNEAQLTAGVTIPQGTYTLSFVIPAGTSGYSWGMCTIFSASGYNEFYGIGAPVYNISGVVLTASTATISLYSYM